MPKISILNGALFSKRIQSQEVLLAWILKSEPPHVDCYKDELNQLKISPTGWRKPMATGTELRSAPKLIHKKTEATTPLV